ncbi:hypothetical protein GCM10008938_39050 [Deinococcus roseus]|uniref:Uncharacterized protein n=1 Tax=Deinococcus roseus TaxID=392414 RepID=A0ABQ2D891_9DEIO|nr:hypothetical protein GCM10008938_39050 [Deinococcus roseus]
MSSRAEPSGSAVGALKAPMFLLHEMAGLARAVAVRQEVQTSIALPREVNGFFTLRRGSIFLTVLTSIQNI